MTYKEVKTMIAGMGLPYTYYSFPNNIAPEPPYIVFNYPETDDLLADNSNYANINTLNLELYTASKDIETEETIEAALNQNGFVYEKTEDYIRQEELFQITYVSSFVKE
ncbi:MAG: hypothetical protein IKD59_05355 [Lachnospiraceae bacterium]|nr:hypothetical protein [Lachnospiraceae bacterium]